MSLRLASLTRRIPLPTVPLRYPGCLHLVLPRPPARLPRSFATVGLGPGPRRSLLLPRGTLSCVFFCNGSRPVSDGAWYWLDTCTRYAPLSLRLPDRAVRSRSVQFVLAGFAQVSMPRPRRPAWRGRPDIGLAKEKATAVLAQVRPLGLGLGGPAQPAPQGPPREAKSHWPVRPPPWPRCASASALHSEAGL